MEDDSIIDLYWQRSEEAITATADKYGQRLQGLAFNITHSRPTAEECVNDAYHAAWNSMPPQRPSYLLPFLAQITRRLALGRLDYERAQKRDVRLTLVFDELADCLPAAASVDSQWEDGQILAVIGRFLRSLPAEQRAVFLCRYWYAEPLADLASRFGYSQSKLKSLLYRLRRQLRSELEQEGVEL